MKYLNDKDRKVPELTLYGDRVLVQAAIEPIEEEMASFIEEDHTADNEVAVLPVQEVLLVGDHVNPEWKLEEGDKIYVSQPGKPDDGIIIDDYVYFVYRATRIIAKKENA